MKVLNKIDKKQFSPIYLLYGTESYIINEARQKIVANVLTTEEMDFNFSVYDLEETSIDDAIEDAETYPFLGDKKLVIVQNPSFLLAEKQKEKIEHNLNRLETYLLEPSPYTIFVFYAPYEKLDERKKITKLLKKHSEVIEGKKMQENDIKNWIKEQINLQQLSIESEAIERLLTLVGSDLMRIHTEIEKLSLYAFDTKKIDVPMVDALTARSLEQNIFDLIEKVVQRKMEEAFRIYYDLRKQNEEPIKILALISSQFRLIYQVKERLRQGYSQPQIAAFLKVHPYRIKLAAGQTNRFSEEQLTKVMTVLALTDEQLKTSSSSRDVAMEMFLLKLSVL